MEASPPVIGGGGGEGGRLDTVDAAPFLVKTYEMVDDASTNAVVSWGAGSDTFVVWDAPVFVRDFLPKYFKHSNFSSFVRQLNTYGFRKVHPDRWEFANECFLRDKKNLLKAISRRKSSQGHNEHTQVHNQNASVAACVEVGKFGVEEEIVSLKRDKNVLMQEIVRLREQQQASGNQLQAVEKCLQGMEQRQQQMMSFLVKAMQSPGFMAQFVQQSECTRRVSTLNRKRRLPKQDASVGSKNGVSDGQMIKYQPLINEAAKAMLLKILKLDITKRFESRSRSDSFWLRDIVPAIDPYDSSSTTTSSRATLSEVSSTSSLPRVAGSAGVSTKCSPKLLSEIQSPAVMANNLPKGYSNLNTVSSVNAASCRSTSSPELAKLLDMAVDVSNENLVGGSICPEQEAIMAAMMATQADEFEPVSSDGHKLPGIIDPFWEQLLAATPLAGDNEEVDSSLEDNIPPKLENGWNDLQSLVALADQAGFLIADRGGL